MMKHKIHNFCIYVYYICYAPRKELSIYDNNDKKRIRKMIFITIRSLYL